MNEHSRNVLENYYAQAASWNDDRIGTIRSSNRLAWRIAATAVVIAILEALALALLMPLKTVEPYTLMVDRTTGYVQALSPLNQSTIQPDAALTQAFLAQYVIAREGFDIATLNPNYRRVSLFSAEGARSSYLQLMQATNPSSPLVIYPRTTLVEARVKSVSPIGANVALVRFDTVRTDAGTQPTSPSAWAAVVRYRYTAAPMKLEDRLVNPLGFQVVSHRKDPEAAPLSPVASTASMDGDGHRITSAVPAGQMPVLPGPAR